MTKINIRVVGKPSKTKKPTIRFVEKESLKKESPKSKVLNKRYV